MKNILQILTCFLFYTQLTAQYCTNDARYSEKDFFNSSQISSITDLKYGSAVNKEGALQELHLDIHYPNITADSSPLRPFIMLIHGGGFQSGEKESMTYECQELAKRGYVTATMEYRLGSATDDILEQVLRIYRADQDAQAAMRWIVDNASTYAIDTSWMFVGGVSAGSVMSHNIIYTQQADWNSFFPLASTQLGNLYTSGNALSHTFSVKGLYNNCGSAIGPSVKTDEMLPTISFHKVHDNVVDVDTSSTSNSYGSRTMHNWLNDENVCSELTLDTNYYSPSSALESHCPFFDLAGIKMRVNRASCFFKSIFCTNCSSAKMDDIIDANCSEHLNAEELNTFDRTFSVYPNPSAGKYELAKTSSWLLYDAQQKLITKGTGKQVNIDMYPDGIYFLHVEGNVFKLIKLNEK